MPVFLYSALAWFASNLIAKVLIGAGLGIYSYHLISDFTDDMINNIVNQVNSGVSADLLQILSLGGFITALNTIISAMTIVGYFMAIKLVVGRNS